MERSDEYLFHAGMNPSSRVIPSLILHQTDTLQILQRIETTGLPACHQYHEVLPIRDDSDSVFTN